MRASGVVVVLAEVVKEMMVGSWDDVIVVPMGIVGKLVVSGWGPSRCADGSSRCDRRWWFRWGCHRSCSRSLESCDVNSSWRL